MDEIFTGRSLGCLEYACSVFVKFCLAVYEILTVKDVRLKESELDEIFTG